MLVNSDRATADHSQKSTSTAAEAVGFLKVAFARGLLKTKTPVGFRVKPAPLKCTACPAADG